MIVFEVISLKQALKKGINFCIFIAILFPILSCNSTRKVISVEEEKQAWKIVKKDKSDEPSWLISTRKIAGTNFLEYKIEGDIESLPKACINSFRQDINNLASDPENKKYPTYDIVDESEDSILTYVIHREYFPMKNTEMSVRYKFFNSEDGSTGVTWKEAWDESPVQPTKKLSRVDSFRGSWHFSPISSNLSKAVNSVHFDPKKMPRWLFEPMVFKFLKKGLKDIRVMTSKPNEV